MRYQPTPVRMSVNHQKKKKKKKDLQITNVVKDVEKKEPLYTIDGNVNWQCHCGKQCGGFSESLKSNNHMI